MSGDFPHFLIEETLQDFFELYHSTREILEAVQSGSIKVSTAERYLKTDVSEIIGEIAKLDISRSLRRGVPEVIYAEGKSVLQLKSIVERIISVERRRGYFPSQVIISRLKPEQRAALRGIFKKLEIRAWRLDYFEEGNIGLISHLARPNTDEKDGGRVALLSAGTSDIHALSEARVVLQAMGCKTLQFNDVGVAGLGRLTKPLKSIQKFDPDALIVAAGMEGALPSVIAGLSGVPVIGLPTSVGHGYGGKGEAALMSMLQACPLGVCAVNIDGGVSAGVIAALIANRCARMRKE